MFPGQPNATEILCATRTTTGTLITIPAGSWFTGTLTISGSVAVLGNSNPTVTTSGTNAAPASGTVVGRINLAGLAATTVADTGTFEVVALAPSGNDITLEFTAGASGTSSATINGYIF
jgi:hypothetical protein